MNNKSVIFLINGLGVEKAGSYSIALDQCMPNLARTRETSFFTTAVIDSLEYRSAYQSFFLGNTSKAELNYIKEHIINEDLKNNPTYQKFTQSLATPNSKLHIFLEPKSEKIVEQINQLVNTLTLEANKQIYLHLLLTQQTTNEYQKLIDIINYIKYHINSHITVGFIIGKEYYPEEMTKEEITTATKLLFYCSAERWSETDKKLLSLKEANIRPCVVPGFCALNTCNIENGDTILFFNINSTSYDKFISLIYDQAPEVFKEQEVNLPIYSLIKLDTKYQIPFISENIIYEDSLSRRLEKIGKKSLIVTDEKYLQYINFIANGLSYVNNPNIQFVKADIPSLQKREYLSSLIEQSGYDLIIFDFQMDTSKTINHLKEQLTAIDIVLGSVADICVNKYSLFISSLYGLKKTLPLADYNNEMVTLDYEMQIPIFFFDYRYLRSKYYLFPGATNDILSTALWCISSNPELYTLIKEKGFINNILKIFQKK